LDARLLAVYLSTVYELPASAGAVRASLDGDARAAHTRLPDALRARFAIVTAYNPRSVVTAPAVNAQRHRAMHELLLMGGHQVEACVAHGQDAQGATDDTWREPSWFVRDIEREEAIAFGRAFRQNAIVFSDEGRPEIVATDADWDAPGKGYAAAWRVRP
jgi:hypothetical protein